MPHDAPQLFAYGSRNNAIEKTVFPCLKQRECREQACTCIGSAELLLSLPASRVHIAVRRVNSCVVHSSFALGNTGMSCRCLSLWIAVNPKLRPSACNGRPKENGSSTRSGYSSTYEILVPSPPGLDY
eukprot:4728294-Pleurochrysis_carterae.AAC.2